MKPASALMLLGTALLLISSANCDICPDVKKDVEIFMKGSVKEYVEYIAKFKNNPLILENAEILKKCIDAKMTEEDKDLVLSGLEKVYASSLC